MLETASFHIVKHCNLKCKFCYATFTDIISKQIDILEVKQILLMLKEAGLEKITFAGGEPLLYKNLHEVIVYAKEIGLTTGIITNGSLLTDRFYTENKGVLDWIGLSVDSLDPLTNYKSGRHIYSYILYRKIVKDIKRRGFKLKINTVVHKYNQNESLQYFINSANPDRWKIFDTLRVEGQNDTEFLNIKPDKEAFADFIKRHKHPNMVVENNAAMTGSYLLIDPLGRLFENSKGKHTYSKRLIESTVSECLQELYIDRKMFIERGGIYKW